MPSGEPTRPGVVVLHEAFGLIGFCIGGGFALLAPPPRRFDALFNRNVARRDGA